MRGRVFPRRGCTAWPTSRPTRAPCSKPAASPYTSRSFAMPTDLRASGANRSKPRCISSPFRSAREWRATLSTTRYEGAASGTPSPASQRPSSSATWSRASLARPLHCSFWSCGHFWAPPRLRWPMPSPTTSAMGLFSRLTHGAPMRASLGSSKPIRHILRQPSASTVRSRAHRRGCATTRRTTSGRGTLRLGRCTGRRGARRRRPGPAGRRRPAAPRPGGR